MQMNTTDSCTLKLKVSNRQLSKDVYSCTPSTYVFRGDNCAMHIFLWVGGRKLPLTKKKKDIIENKRCFLKKKKEKIVLR